MDPDCEPLADYLFPAAKILDPFGLENMRFKWRKWLNFDCNWKVAMEAFNETYHVFTTHPEFNKFGEFKGWAKAQGKHSNIGYDAPKGMDETKSKIRLGTGDPRISTAEMQVYTMEETNATTTQTLVNAAKRLVDELPEGTPADKVLEHWLASARRDDEARGVVWPTIPADILGQSGTAWQIFPNFQIGQGLTSALCYSARPDPSYDPNKCIFEVAVFELYPKGQEPQTEWQYTPVGDPELAVGAAAGLLEHGRRAAGHEVRWASPAPSPTRTANAAPSTCTTSCRSTWAPANHRSFETNDHVRHVRTDPDARGRRYRRAAGEVRCRSATKRLRPEGSEQYLELKDDFADFAEVDPHTPVTPRDADRRGRRSRRPRRRVSPGLLAGAYLKKAGVDDVRVIEMAGDFGGVWYWNRFPGIQCDNDAYCYIPMLEELDFMPTQEVRRRRRDLRALPQHRQALRPLRRRDLLHAGRDLRWDEKIKRWRLTTNRGDDIRARFVVMAQGSYNRPKLPGIPGIKDTSSRGHVFHSARWDYDYTGGDANGGLHKLADKRVALVGTGATGVQLVPHLGRDAKQLYVFQRTPSSVDERGNTPTDPQWAASLQPGWQEERKRNFHSWSPFVGCGVRSSRTWSATSGPNWAAT